MSRAAPGRGRGRTAVAAVLTLLLAASLLTVAVTANRRLPAGAPPLGLFPAGHTRAAPAGLVPPGAAAPAQSRRPNIVLVLTDDMRADDLRWMPEVRRLLRGRGLLFRNSFSPYPLCCPARASLLSGQYAHNHKVFSHAEPFGFQVFDDRRTLGTSLNAAGYNTLFVGKYLNGYGPELSRVTGEPSFRYVPPGWTDWYGSVKRPLHSGYPSGGTYNYWHGIFNVDGRIDDSHNGQYQTYVVGGMARRLLRRYHRSPKPFFLYFAPIAPHFGSPHERDDPPPMHKPGSSKVERIVTPARPEWVRGRFDARIPRASGLPVDGGPSERDVSDKPRPMNHQPELSRQERLAVRASTRQRAEALYVLDGQVRRLLATLRRTHELANTVVMFTSDNGYFLGEHRMRQGKIKPHEPSLRVPFVVAGPGIPHGTRYDPVTIPGITATILDIAGARPPHPADGLSVVRSFGHDRGWSVPVVTEGLETQTVFRLARQHPALGFDDPRTTIGIRTARWMYVRYVDGDGELYDLDRDPNELTNRFDSPRYASVQARLDRVWQRFKDCRGAGCRARLPPSLRRGPHQEQVETDQQSRGVERRYGYWR